MNLISKIPRKVIRSILKPFIREDLFDYSKDTTLLKASKKRVSSECINAKIKNLLAIDQPCMIARLGNTELTTIIKFDNFIKMNRAERVYEWARSSKYPFSRNCILNQIYPESGFYPVNKSNLERFKTEVIASMQEADVIGSWIDGESRFIDYMNNASVCNLKDLEPYFHKDPWSKALEDKKVLVIHPFTKTIESQYNHNRENIFSDVNILPDFELKCLKTLFTTPGGKLGKEDWFNELDSLYRKAVEIDFDIAIIGCGSYGFPLAAKLKKFGKKSIHLGGATQLMFGIRGKRWDNNQLFKQIFNDYWVYPSDFEKPQDSQGMDKGCFWK